MAQIIQTTFQFKRGDAEKWNELNPILAEGEPGFELDTNKFKIGNGINTWKELPYKGEGNIVNAQTRNEFPVQGNENAIYKAQDEKLLYQWNPNASEYEVLGTFGETDDGDFITVDTELSTSSMNPVANKVIAMALQDFVKDHYTKQEVDTTIENTNKRIDLLEGTTHFRGIYPNLNDETLNADLYEFSAGDVFIVENAEYICTTSGNLILLEKANYEKLGDVSAEIERISALEEKVGNEKNGEIEATGLYQAIAGLENTKVDKTDIVNTLDSTALDKPLSAAMGKELNSLIKELSTNINDAYVKQTELNDAVNTALETAKESGEFDGQDGGHYIPSVKDNGNGTMTVTFTASKSDMSDVNPITISLPAPNNGKDGDDGEDGGYYIPSVNTISNNKFKISFTASKTGMPSVADVTITLPTAKDGADGVGISSVVQTTTSTNDGGENVITVTLTDNTQTTFKVKNGSKGSAGRGISKVEKTSTSDLTDTYTITYTDSTTSTFTVVNGKNGTNGVGIETVAQTTTSSADGGENVITVTLTDGTTSTFKIKNGSKGSKGDAGNGIKSIAKTSTSGLVDTYTITFTDNTTATFTVTNGKAGTSVTVSKVTESAESGGSNVVEFSDGHSLSVKNGRDGTNGKDGKSAYAYALEDGYGGTEGAFAAKLAENNMFSSYDRFADSLARMRVNPQEPLAIVTYDGSNKPTHPSALYVPEGWNGHKYWLGYTPFPNNENKYENPCLAYSDDGVNFSSAGLTNPVENYPTENGVKVGFNSDVDIVLVNGVLECWWRTCQQSGTRPGYEIIYRKKGTPTANGGISWSAKEELYSVENAGFAKCLSPAVIYKDGQYHIWYGWLLSKLIYCTSTDGTNWQQVREIDVDQNLYPEYKIWHFDILYTEGIGYEFVGSYRLEGDAGSNRYVFYARSRDNVTYTPPTLILTCGDEGNFDDTELYRPSIIREPTGVKVYYGCRSGHGNWRVGLIEAPNPYLFNTILKRKAWEEHVEEKLAQINAVPCTGVTLNQSALTFTLATSQTLTATVEPAHTTDELTWSVSPKGIVTVTDGVVTPVADVRSGECVVTATCGAYSASCAVTLKIPSANLFDDVTWEAGTINASGADAAKSDNRRSGYIDVTHLRGSDILLYAKDGNAMPGNLALFFYDENKVFQSTLATTNDTKRCLTCVVPENATYLRVAVYTNAGALKKVVLYSGNPVAPSTLATQQTGKYYNTTDGALKSGSGYNCYAIPVNTDAGFLFVSYAYSAVRLASDGSFIANYVINTTNTSAYTGFSALENDGYLGLNVQAANTDKCLVKMPTHLLGSKEF